MKRINKKIKIFWGISEVGFTMTSYMSVTFMMYFLTDIAKLPLSISGIIASLSGIGDAISSIIAGIVLDKVHLKSGRNRPWLLYCPPIVAVLFTFTFTKIGGDILAGLIIGVCYVLARFLWNIAWTANRNLLPSLTDDPDERSFLSSRIAIGQALGKIGSAYLVPVMSTAFMALFTGVASYTFTAAACTVLYIICYYIHYVITKGYDAGSSSKKPVSFKDMAKGVATNPHLITFFIHDTIRLVAYFLVAATAAYYAKVVLEDASIMGWLLVMFHAGALVGSYFSRILAKKIGAKATSAVGVAGCALLLICCYFLPANLSLVTIILFLAQVAWGLAYGLTSSIYTMCGTYSFWKTGENIRGVVMSFSALAGKIGIAARGALIPVLLAMIAYDPAATVMTEAAKSGVKFLFLGVSSIGMLISLIPLALFRMNEKKVVEMEKEIASREGA